MSKQFVTRVDYFEVALELLASGGATQIKVNAMCEVLKVTSGSFYGYFGSMSNFVKDFLKYWELSQTDRVAKMITAPTDLVTRMRIMKNLTASLPHAAEAAIRAWAYTNEDVAAMQRAVDERRLETLAEILEPTVRSAKEARELAILAMTLLVGLQQWRQPVTRADFDLVFDRFERAALPKAIEGDASVP